MTEQMIIHLRYDDGVVETMDFMGTQDAWFDKDNQVHRDMLCKNAAQTTGLKQPNFTIVHCYSDFDEAKQAMDDNFPVHWVSWKKRGT